MWHPPDGSCPFSRAFDVDINQWPGDCSGFGGLFVGLRGMSDYGEALFAVSTSFAATVNDRSTAIPHFTNSDAATSVGSAGNGPAKENLVSEFTSFPT